MLHGFLNMQHTMNIKDVAVCISCMLFITYSAQVAVAAEQEENSCHGVTYNACIDKSEGITTAMVECMEAERLLSNRK